MAGLNCGNGPPFDLVRGGHMKNHKITSYKYQVREIFSFYRSLILDLLEQDIGDLKSWPYLRSRILRALSSDRGLEYKIQNLDKPGDL